MRIFIASVFFFTTLSIGANYPVDDEIAGLRAKATYLETLKTVFEKNKCSIELGKTKVGLSAGALRSEGLVIAIGDGFPGNYLAYHKAPKPEKLEFVVNVTLQSNTAGAGASIITARLKINPTTKKVEKLGVIVNEVFKEPTSEDLWLYTSTGVALPISTETAISAEGKGLTETTKRPYTVRCN